MSRKQAIAFVVFALFAGFLGGIASQQVGLTVLAQAGPAEKVEAQEFHLVDAKGRLLGLIKAAPMSSDVEFESGEVLIVPKGGQELSIPKATGGAIMLFDGAGHAIWAAPDPVGSAARVRPLK
jgi:hypothetical protein